MSLLSYCKLNLHWSNLKSCSTTFTYNYEDSILSGKSLPHNFIAHGPGLNNDIKLLRLFFLRSSSILGRYYFLGRYRVGCLDVCLPWEFTSLVRSVFGRKMDGPVSITYLFQKIGKGKGAQFSVTRMANLSPFGQLR